MNKKKNQLKSAIVSTLLMTSKAIENSTLQQVNNTSLVNLNQGTGVNYTSPQQLSNLKKYLSPYNSHNYTGHYDSTKHTHEQIDKNIKIKDEKTKKEHKYGTNSINYTSLSQLKDAKNHSLKYDHGHYDPAKHDHEHNIERAL